MELEITNDDKLRKALSYRWVIFWILAFGYVLVYFHRLCPAVVAIDMMKDLNAGGALTGFLSAAYFYPYALMQLPAGLLSDTWGPRKTITLFFIIAFAGSVILGFAPSVALAILGRTLVGIGIAMLFVATMKVLAEWFKKNRVCDDDRNSHGHGRSWIAHSHGSSCALKRLDRLAVFIRHCRYSDTFTGCSDMVFRI